MPPDPSKTLVPTAWLECQAQQHDEARVLANDVSIMLVRLLREAHPEQCHRSLEIAIGKCGEVIAKINEADFSSRPW